MSDRRAEVKSFSRKINSEEVTCREGELKGSSILDES